MDKDDFENQLLKRLNVVISLLVDLKSGYNGGEVTTRDKIALLNNAGLNYREIAQILDKKDGYIAVELSSIKKKKEKTKSLLGVK